VRVAGYTFKTPLFTRDALALIAGSSGGVPRTINNLCFNALSLGYARRKHPLDAAIMSEVIADLDIDLIDRWKKKTLSRPPAPPIPGAVHPGRYATP
jgi:hypothetical protein